METNNFTPNTPNRGNSRMVAGIIILCFGCILLARRTGMFFVPHWLFSWPVLLIAIGLYSGAKSNFTKTGWLWMVGIGSAFLLMWHAGLSAAVVWPILLICVGVFIITKHQYGPRNGPPNDQFTDYTEVK